MKDEFTTAMHADMLGWSQEDAKLIEIYSMLRHGYNKWKACKEHNITVEYYEKNIEEAKKRCF